MHLPWILQKAGDGTCQAWLECVLEVDWICFETHHQLGRKNKMKCKLKANTDKIQKQET